MSLPDDIFAPYTPAFVERATTMTTMGACPGGVAGALSS